jgi:Carboxypeptidase regulatory-like domain/TonB-dependent Receptor Plug Domain
MHRKLVSLTLGWLLVLCTSVWAQQSASSGIVGQVTDAQQAVIPGATVTVTNTGTGAQRTTTTDAEGRFSVPNLPPANYSIRVELQGFQAAEVKDLVLRVGETVRPTISLTVGGVDETIQVEAADTLLQTSSASVGQVIGERQIENLPLNGRNVLSLAALSAGVTPRSFTRGAAQYGRRNQYITVEGGRDSSTNYTVDGVYVRSLRFNNLSINPPVDAVQEVSLLRNSFSTEYGQGQAVVSIVTKSGSNLFSGSAYEFVRNDKFDARNYFAATKPKFERNQYGATGGGPIKKNRIFVFGGYEGLRTTQGQALSATVPNPTLLTGDFSSLSTTIRDPLTGQPFAGNRIPAERISKFAKLLAPTVPAPNSTGAFNYRIQKNFLDDADTATIRSDQTLNSSNNMFQRFMWYDGRQTNPAVFLNTNLPQKGRNLAVGETWVISPTLINEVRFGYNYAYHLTSPLSFDGRNWTQEIGLRNLAGSDDPLLYGRPSFNMTGFTNNGEGGITQGATENIFSFSNATSKVAGRHNLRFGIQGQYRKFEHLTEVGPRGAFTFNGQYTGNSIADFLLGYCSTCTGTFGTSNSDYRSMTLAPFVDDVWNVSPKLTIQAGLRWEYLAPWKEQNGQEGAFDLATGKIGYHKVPANLPAALVPLVIQQDDFYPAGIVKKDLNNWGPRLGVTYNLTEKTVIRSGFGVYYDNLNLNELQFMRLVPPFYGSYSIQPNSSTLVASETLFPDINNIAQFPAPFSIGPDNKTPFTYQWNVNFQRSFGRNYLVEIAYTASESRNLSKRYNANQADFGTTPQITRLPYPAFQPAILYSSDEGWANFKGLSLRLEKRYSGGLYFLGNYQLSENRDNGSGEIEANDTAYRTNFDADASLSRYNNKHRAAISFGYELPFGPGRKYLANGGALAYVLGGWQTQGIVRMASGFPFTVTGTNVCACGNYVPQRVVQVGSSDGKLDNATPERWFDPTAYTLPAAGFQGTVPRNSLIGPSSQQVDFSITRRFAVHNNTRIEFRAEIFNLFNHTNFGQPDANISNTTAGIISSADDARSMQFGLRLAW